MTGRYSAGGAGGWPDRKALVRHVKSLPKEVRRDVQAALASASPVRDPTNAALAAELAAVSRRLIARTGLLTLPVAPAVAASAVWMVGRSEGRESSPVLLGIVVVVVAAVMGLTFWVPHRRLLKAERINWAVAHRAGSDPTSYYAATALRSGAPGGLAAATEFPGLRELRVSIGLGLALALVLIVGQFVLVGPESLWRLAFALMLATLWWRAPTEPGRVALLLVVIYGGSIAALAPRDDPWDGAALPVLVAGLAFALAGLWRSRPYRRAAKAERKRLLSGDEERSPS